MDTVSPLRPILSESISQFQSVNLNQVVTISVHSIMAWHLCRNVSNLIFLHILEDFAGDFSGGYFGREKIQRQNPAETRA